MLKYKIDVLTALKKSGYNTLKLRKDKILSESTIQKLRENKMIATSSLEKICDITDLQPGDIIENKKRP